MGIYQRSKNLSAAKNLNKLEGYIGGLLQRWVHTKLQTCDTLNPSDIRTTKL